MGFTEGSGGILGFDPRGHWPICPSFSPTAHHCPGRDFGQAAKREFHGLGVQQVYLIRRQCIVPDEQLRFASLRDLDVG